MRLIDYLPIEIIFNILCFFRRRWNDNQPANRTALKQRGLRNVAFETVKIQRPIPRLPFWIRICQSASLLDEDPYPYPTLLADEWMAWPFYNQIACLVEAWKESPRSEKLHRLRTDLLKRLQRNDSLGAAHRQELVGLYALGVCEGERLSHLGLTILNNKDREQFTGKTPLPWRIETHPATRQLIVPFPPDWKLVWELEKYLDPIASGDENEYAYPLDSPALRRAAQRGATDNHPSLPEILERGLGESPPAELIRWLAEKAIIRLIPGFVLEFTHSDELKRLRQLPGLRHELDHLLSPRHVALDAWHGLRLMQKLYRLGLLSENDLSSTQLTGCAAKQAPNPLTKSERVYLLCLMLLAEGLQNVIAPPPGLLAKLTKGVDHSLRAAAARKATAALNQINPQPAWQPEESPPPMPPEELIETLQKAIDRGEAIDIFYQSSGHHSPEYRHVTPLLVEPRGERYYLIAYCHNRRANRTFRLDRVKLCVENN